MTKRCVELLNITEDSPPLYLLDIGCGSGLSGNVLTELGHVWVGLDIAPSMLEIASQREGSKNEDLMLWDMGHGLSFRQVSRALTCREQHLTHSADQALLTVRSVSPRCSGCAMLTPRPTTPFSASIASFRPSTLRSVAVLVPCCRSIPRTRNRWSCSLPRPCVRDSRADWSSISRTPRAPRSTS
jgi:SAM-dependent methyltransferase